MKIFKPCLRVLAASSVTFATSAIFVSRPASAADSTSGVTSTKMTSSSVATVPVATPIGEVAFQTLAMGTGSGCTRAAKMLITTEKEWRRVWSIHTGSSQAPVPNVDWSHQVVVALLGGQGNASLQINQIVRAPDSVVVFIDDLSHPDGVAQDKTKQGARAFHFALIEKPQSPLRFQDLSNPECATCVLKPGE